MTFVKGKSGNPGGRPRGYADIAAAARSHSKDALAALVRGLDDEKLYVQAAEAILNRGFGKPKQMIEGALDLGLADLMKAIDGRTRGLPRSG